MSQRQTLLRYSAIIKKVMTAPVKLAEIQAHLEKESDIRGENLTTSTRTFQRDLDDIRSLFLIDIQYDFSLRKYRVLHSESEEYSSRVLEAFETINALQLNAGMSQYLDFEQRKASGLEHFYGILHAIKNRQQLNFSYKAFWQEKAYERKTNPYLLKEFKGRWYMLAKDLRDEQVKTYALDRFGELEITKKRFSRPKDFDPAETFRNSFGIITPTPGTAPQKVVLAFDPFQGKYVKTQLLHHSQKTLIDDETEFRVELKICIAFDLVKELLSFGSALRVIEPEELMEEVKKAHKEAWEKYEGIIG